MGSEGFQKGIVLERLNRGNQIICLSAVETLATLALKLTNSFRFLEKEQKGALAGWGSSVGRLAHGGEEEKWLPCKSSRQLVNKREKAYPDTDVGGPGGMHGLQIIRR